MPYSGSNKAYISVWNKKDTSKKHVVKNTYAVNVKKTGGSDNGYYSYGIGISNIKIPIYWKDMGKVKWVSEKITININCRPSVWNGSGYTYQKSISLSGGTSLKMIDP